MIKTINQYPDYPDSSEKKLGRTLTAGISIEQAKYLFPPSKGESRSNQIEDVDNRVDNIESEICLLRERIKHQISDVESLACIEETDDMPLVLKKLELPEKSYEQQNQQEDTQLKKSFLETVMSKLTDVLTSIEKPVSKTLQYYLYITPFIPHKEKIGQFLNNKLPGFDLDEMKRLGKKPLYDVEEVTAAFKKGSQDNLTKGVLNAVEKFWATWNPYTHNACLATYIALGGKKKPVQATMGTFLYSGVFFHSLHPCILPVYSSALAFTGNGYLIVPTAIAIAGIYTLGGIPIAIQKYVKHKKAQNNPYKLQEAIVDKRPNFTQLNINNA